MFRFLFLQIILFPVFSFGQPEIPLGQGIIEVDFEKPPVIYFYQDTLQQQPVKIITIIKNKEEDLVLKNPEQAQKWFSPETFSPDYSLFVMRVDTMIGKWYRVYVNNETKTTLWTKKEAIKKFYAWPEFLINRTTAVEVGYMSQAVKKLPSDNAPTIKKLENEDCLEALEVQGEWIKVRTNTKLDCNTCKKPVKAGWIRWKKDGKLIISFALTC